MAINSRREIEIVVEVGDGESGDLKSRRWIGIESKRAFFRLHLKPKQLI